MKQFNVFASNLRINVLLCCSAAVLLSACGGNIDADGGQQLATAAEVTTDAGLAATGAAAAAVEAAPEAAVEAAAAAAVEAAPVASTAGATGQAADVTTQAFELTGYDSNPLEPQTEQQEAGASAPASTTDGATRLSAASVATPATTYNGSASPTGSDSANTEQNQLAPSSNK